MRQGCSRGWKETRGQVPPRAPEEPAPPTPCFSPSETLCGRLTFSAAR